MEESRDSNETTVVILSARLFIVVLEFRGHSNEVITPEERERERKKKETIVSLSTINSPKEIEKGKEIHRPLIRKSRALR